ncbi:hypothetical protein BTM25_41860 [Actinomadura rubteroloni]|uniref:Uncharacterized protein n=1 Tax=Actinomadura rubteroloni TaxID=1926885 RepID=A0A2P4UKH9_9ACTN|nr:hypothetical protein [Actinomadura rubteroloni]POM25538.1 hypothetical protein BTM25_41860 [Actinomadura rubteroloni]
MSSELTAWHASAPVTPGEAAAQNLDDLAEHFAVIAFAKDLEAEPGAEVETPGGKYARVQAGPEHGDAVTNAAYRLARAHGLVLHDRGRGLVHNLGPRGVHEGMQFHTGDGLVITDPDLDLVHDALGRLGPANPFAALVVFGSHFVQVSPEGGTYELEHKHDGVLHRTTAGLDAVRRAFREYATGDDAFRARHAWTRAGAP